jgi:glycine/D-amino acid oxidase-like deaminating enzyme
MSYDVCVVGAGIFGLTAAVELQMRGFSTAIFDPGPIPHPLAASADISKIVRMEYGSDEDYMNLVRRSMPGWHKWNNESTETLFHQTGILLCKRSTMKPGDFEYESYQLLKKHGYHPERLCTDEISHRFPAWKPGVYIDGFYDRFGGFAESGKVIDFLKQKAKILGVTIVQGNAIHKILFDSSKVQGVKSKTGEEFVCGQVIVAAGSWTPFLVPQTTEIMRVTGHPVFHLKVDKPELYDPAVFPVFMADIANAGWYGFPLHPSEGIIKIANHGDGLELHPQEDERIVSKKDQKNLKQFLKSAFPGLVNATITYTRRCLYCDTLDEHFLIDNHPEIEGLIVASGGSGHGFKFGPVLGALIADVAEKKANPWIDKFSWRSLHKDTRGEEASRNHRR